MLGACGVWTGLGMCCTYVSGNEIHDEKSFLVRFAEQGLGQLWC